MNLKSFLKNKIPQNLICKIQNSFEIIGDICIINIEKDLEKYETEIAKQITLLNKNIKTILKIKNIFDGDYRTRKFEFLYGEKKFETRYKENKIVLKVNVLNVYFSSKLSNEREEIFFNDLNKKNILIGFCGVGPYTFNCLKKNPNVNRIDSIEINPKAKKYFLENKYLNKSILKKSNLFIETLNFLKENKIYFKDREILKNLIDLKCIFFSNDFKSQIKLLNISKYKVLEENIGYFDFINKELLKRDFFEIFTFLDNVKFIAINLDSFEKSLFYILKYILIFFKNKKFFFKYKGDYFFVKDDFSKSIFLNFFEKNIFEENIIYDEIFMPAPFNSFEFLKDVITICRKNSIIYFYIFLEIKNFEKIALEKVKEFSKENNLKVKVLKIKNTSQISKSKIRCRVSFQIL